MKQTNKNFLFSNFNQFTISHTISKNNLNISDFFNLTTKNSVIEPVNNFTDFFKTYFNKDSYETLKANNQKLINSIIFISVYTYYNENINDVVSRIFIIDINNKLYELDSVNLIFNDLNFAFSSQPTELFLDNKLYLLSQNDLSLVIENDDYPISISSQPNIISIANFQGYTIFAVNEKKFSIYISEKNELLNLDNDLSNYQEIELSHNLGKIYKIIIYILSNITIHNKHKVVN